MQITIYSTTTCPYCKMVKDFLNEKSLPFTEKLVDQDDLAKEEMEKISEGYLGVPYVVVEKDGIQTKIVGFDKLKLNQAMGLVEE